MNIKRGEIYLAALDPVVGKEISKTLLRSFCLKEVEIFPRIPRSKPTKSAPLIKRASLGF
jgi:hypothetical protein